MIPDLIYDVGMNNGDDTAYYLYKGFRVVAIEADPRLIAAARGRFATPIALGRLTLLDCGVAATEGSATFWVCEDNSAWSAFDPALGQRTGKFHGVEVPCRTFESILHEFGVPYFLKGDIEGFEDLCMAAIDPANRPAYVSREMGDLANLIQLRDKGYNAFKIISQRTHRHIRFDPGRPALASDVEWQFDPAAQGEAAWKRKPGEDGWSFPFGSAGPCAEWTDGPWLSADEAAFAFLAQRLGHLGAARDGASDWFDLHATVRQEAAAAKLKTPAERVLELMEARREELGRSPRAWLFGAGQHTEKLLEGRALWQEKGFAIAGLIDDSPKFAGTHLGLPVLTRAAALAAGGIDLIILSTDTFEDHFYALTEEFRNAGVPTVRLYGKR